MLSTYFQNAKKFLRRLFLTSNARLKLCEYSFYAVFFLLFVRSLHLYLASHPQKLKRLADRQYNVETQLASYRGTIFDHKGDPLAVSINTPSIAINPRVFNPSKAQLHQLAKILKLPVKQLATQAKRRNYFAWLKRKVPFSTAQQINALKLKGAFQVYEHKRLYPNGMLAANLLGYVGTDNVGLFGLERMFEKSLNHNKTSLSLLKDAKGQIIFLNSKKAKPEENGHNIVLTIDSAIQKIAEDVVHKWVNKAKATRGFAVVQDPYTGKILAIANHPTFDPNQTSRLNLDNTRNLALSHRFEPGSILKPIVVAQAIDQKLLSAHEIHNCEKSGRLKIKDRYIHDDHPQEFLTTAEVLIYSSNICMYKIAQKLGRSGTYQTYRDFSVSMKKSELGFSHDSVGILSHPKKWSEIRFANIAFGQGFLTTGIEIATAYSALANGGQLIQPRLIDRIESHSGEIIKASTTEIARPVINLRTSQQITQILQRAVQEGTGKAARSSLYSIAGKTGTAEKVDPKSGGYSRHLRTASFAGYGPAEDPRLVVVVVIDEPHEKPYYGGTWAAPAVLEIIESTLGYLNVPSTKSIALYGKPKKQKT